MASITASSVRDWPQEAEDEFERIRVLGAGAFGEVWLAKKRREKNEENNPSEKEEEYAAIKGVSIQTENERRTAAREIAILQEVNHPNIIRLLRGYDPSSPTARGRYLALSFVRGKNVGELLEVRGALTVTLAQLIARHLISAVAYLHVRGVMHRDIKPDNIMLQGWDDGFMWADEEKIQEAVNNCLFKAILVDFGFARATRKEDYLAIEGENVERRTNSSFSVPPLSNKNYFVGRSKRGSILLNSRNRSSNMRASRRVFRAMSAVGTANFAAPEILETIRRQSASTACLTECVSSYALISDAYAVGATLKEVLTGVPPGEDVESYVHANREEVEPVIIKTRKSVFSCCRTDAADAVAQKPNPAAAHAGTICLRYMHELPPPVNDLIVKMMQEKADDRLSVRDAQEHEWIGGCDSLPHGDYPAHTSDPIVFVNNEAAFV